MTSKPRGSIWRPWRALRLHVGVVVVAVGLAVLAASLPATPQAVLASDLATTPLLLLGLPLFLVLPMPAVPESGVPTAAGVAWMAVPALYLLALHWTVGVAARRGGDGRVPGAGGAGAELFVDSARLRVRPRAVVVAVVVVAVGAGVGSWTAWLGLPQTLGLYGPRSPVEQFWPPVAQAGAIATALALALALAGVTRSLGAPIGVGGGLWLAHTVWAAQQDTPLWGVASFLAFVVSTAVVALAVSLSCAIGLIRTASATT